MVLAISIEESDGRRRKVTFEKQVIMIGRASGNDLCLEGKGISRYHARITVDGDQIYVQDLQSTNGTFVNNAQIDKRTINETDKVAVGDIFLCFAKEDANKKESQVKAETSSEDTKDEAPVKPPTSHGFTRSRERIPEPVCLDSSGKISEISSRPEFPDPGEIIWNAIKGSLSPIWSYILDEQVSDILVNGPEEIFIEHDGRLTRAGVKFKESELRLAALSIAKYLGKNLNGDDPFIEVILPEGCRATVVQPNCSKKGILLRIKKTKQKVSSSAELKEKDILTPELSDFFSSAIKLKKTILVSAENENVRTFFLSALSKMLPAEERIIAVVDRSALSLSQEHVLLLDTVPVDRNGRGEVSKSDLIVATQHLRADRLLVSELNGKEVQAFLAATQTGLHGALSSICATSPAQALERLQAFLGAAEACLSFWGAREQIACGVDLIVQLGSVVNGVSNGVGNGGVRVTQIVEVASITSQGDYDLRVLYSLRKNGDQSTLERTAISPTWESGLSGQELV